MNFPSNLEDCVVSYRKLSDKEYEFFLRNFPLMSVRIKACCAEKSNKYHGEVLLPLKDSVEGRIILSEIVSKSVEKTILDSLCWFIECKDKDGFKFKVFYNNMKH